MNRNFNSRESLTNSPRRSQSSGRPVRRSLRAGALLLCLALAAAFFTGCKGKADQNGKEAKKERPVPVEVAEVERGEIEMILKASTNLEVEYAAPVFARTANLVKEVLVEDGDYVEKDQVLVLLEDDVQKTQYERSKIQFEQAEEEYIRDKALHEQKLISDQVFKQKEFEYKRLKLALEDAWREYDYTKVRAPISGTVANGQVEVGYPVNIGSFEIRDGIFEIFDFTSMRAIIHLPEKNLPLLKPGLPARVYPTALPGREYAAHVLRVSPVIKAATGTVKVEIAFDEIGDLRPGMYVDVELVVQKKKDAALVSKRALVYDNDQMFVYRLLPREKESDPRKVERLLIKPVMSDKFNVEPQPGVLEPGDRVVINGQTGLKHHALVRLPSDPDPKEEAVAVAGVGGESSAKKDVGE